MATKMCAGCRRHVLLEAETWAKRSDGSRRPYCRECDNARSRAYYAARDSRPRTAYAAAVDRHEPKVARDAAAALEARKAQVKELIGQYLRVRGTPGPAYAAAHEQLGRALQRHGAPVQFDGRVWRWSRAAADIVSDAVRPRQFHAAQATTPTRVHRVAWERGYEQYAGQRVESEFVLEP